MMPLVSEGLVDGGIIYNQKNHKLYTNVYTLYLSKPEPVDLLFIKTYILIANRGLNCIGGTY